MNDYRSMMPGWTPDHSMILSLLLEVVVGTKEEIAMRQDYCRIHDNFFSLLNNTYFTGSKSEGLDLPGSDEDYMYDINKTHRIRVIQSVDEKTNFSHNNSIFVMSTENVRPGFVLLKHVPPSTLHPFIHQSSRNNNGVWYLSSDLFVHNSMLCRLQNKLDMDGLIQRQGPSMETWTLLQDRSESGTDLVPSIHCAFWPKEASEWVQRQRHFEWPTSPVISSIIDFGFHLVPVGHPNSDSKLMEWRISFSVAERTLVWSFNHVQMQCYAVMKIILKEFIKVNCSPQNQVLCSYFIKTFLFWKYESTEVRFWRADNLRECIKYLLSEFSKCIRDGVLKHYFIPTFNLLSVKLTPAAQHELLHLFDIIIQSDITILKECRTLHKIWSEFVQVYQDRINVLIPNLQRKNFLRNDECAMRIIYSCLIEIAVTNFCRYVIIENAYNQNIEQTLARLSCKTPIKTIVLRKLLVEKHINSVRYLSVPGNKGVYQLCRTANNDTYSFDITTCKIWCAILLYMKGSIPPTLDIINNVLSSIPQFAMYTLFENQASNEAKELYVNIFMNSGVPMTQRARTAWIIDLCIAHDMTDMVPLAIQIELFFHKTTTIRLSPFICMYYLQFLCYHDLHQYNNRDCALQELIDILKDKNRIGYTYISLNIAGHCLLLAGKRDEALVMFQNSYRFTKVMHPLIHETNSATWYLQNCFR